VITIASVGARRHAEKAAGWGIDAVIATGREGGGHVGAVPTSLLIPQVTAAVDIAVIAAGGFYDGRGLVAALAWGAVGIAMGTRFLLTSDSAVPDAVKQLYLQAGLDGTVVTTQVDGAPGIAGSGSGLAAGGHGGRADGPGADVVGAGRRADRGPTVVRRADRGDRAGGGDGAGHDRHVPFGISG